MNEVTLSIEQRERVEALKAAASILRDHAVNQAEISSVDIINLAFWIHTGIDPHDARIRVRAPNPFPDAAEWRADEAPVPRCQHVSGSPWGPAQCALPEGHSHRHAYSPSESGS
jgi:hypothetical protein